jgi:hypothetical protein
MICLGSGESLLIFKLEVQLAVCTKSFSDSIAVRCGMSHLGLFTTFYGGEGPASYKNDVYRSCDDPEDPEIW